jgi:FkbM family methyltransferase
MTRAGTMSVSLYTIKRALLKPRTAYMRRRETELDQFGRAALELHYYRRPMYDFMAASAAKPDLLFDVDVNESSVVLDVGAYDGEWSERISRRYGPTIYAFEPDPTSFRRLATRLGDQPNVVLLQYGLGGADQTATLALDGPGSSIYADSGLFGTAQVQIREVTSVLDELGIEHVDLLKVNIEGGEYDLLDRLIEAGWLPRIRLVSVQFHEWHPKAYRRRRAIRRALRRHHQEVWNYAWVWEYWRRRAT